MVEDSDHAYFQAVEEIFVELRGAPLLLSPADWQVARRWHQEGVPLDLVKRTLEEVFAKRKERGAKGKISSLRYCAPAVEAAWEDLRELTAPGERAEAPAFEVRPRLAALAAALPRSFPEIQARIAALDGDPQQVEDRLATLDREMLDAAETGLDGETRAEIGAAVEKTLAALGGRLPAEELERSRDRLARQALRRRLGLPVLSLFSPEAEGTTRRDAAPEGR
ncbi:MAG TPA: hypothetical protein VHC97_16045 [Thermoanaerobaculia bacterium]|jgi:hypothetical protein|nr:hypothetical protein [Thermoanaerobaculia bacterium]